MDRRALQKVASRIRLIDKAINDLSGARSFQEFSDFWYQFLVNWKNVYTILEVGSKLSAQSRQWYGGVKKERKSDELLQYLFEARNAAEHMLDDSLNAQAPVTVIGAAEPNSSQSIVLNGGGIRNVEITGRFNMGAMVVVGGFPKGLEVRSLDRKPVKIEYSPEKVLLAPINARGRVIDPPTMHLGERIVDPSPLHVAIIATDYIKKLSDTAKKIV
ncbi:hypothetical protein [Jannaschia sp. 2305UL9-9]|uniref:hypothetical protein n=1 Tax=Jannaschia sp. 2305UL9-9 TaxID=3121638 RepID=UPI0035280795